jgi:phosphoglycolate phosphatase-like HAD superfamily hydrolase
MQIIHAVLFEPVGCLAEFPAKEFDEIAARLFQETSVHRSGSEAFWRMLDLLGNSGRALHPSEQKLAEELEVQAVNQVELYEDVLPALSELKGMNIQLLVASSLGGAALSRFLERFPVREFFSATWDRSSAGGVKAIPLAKAMQAATLQPEHVIALVDTMEGLGVARELGANSILMINDYEQGKRLALYAPTGGIVSLKELPDAIRLVAESAKAPRS